MIDISVIILVKNDEQHIADCIDSVTFADEVIVVDNGSTDRTAEIARHMGAKVFIDKEESFAKRRNFGKEKAKGEWILYIDADEIVTNELQQEIVANVKHSDPSIIAYAIYRKNFYLGNHPWPQREQILRLFKNTKKLQWVGILHETPEIEGNKKVLEGEILHYTHRNLREMVAKTNTWSELEAKLRLEAHHPVMSWWRFPRVMLSAFYDSYIRQKGYKVGTAGIIESMYQAFSMFITYAKLWEKQQRNRSQ